MSTRPQIVGGSGSARPPNIEDVMAKHQQIYEITVENKNTVHRIFGTFTGNSHPVMNQAPKEAKPEIDGILPDMMVKLSKILENAEETNKILHDLGVIATGSSDRPPGPR